jgi:hypothetical protein
MGKIFLLKKVPKNDFWGSLSIEFEKKSEKLQNFYFSSAVGSQQYRNGCLDA